MKQQDYRPPLLLRNGHFNTIYGSIFRQQPALPYQRIRISTPDDDFLDIDRLKGNHRKLAILCHGLEGSSNSQYIIGTARLLHNNGWDIVAMNYRGCSGEMNRQIRMYHSGATDDLELVIQEVQADYDTIALVGFSLGGNLATVYCGQQAEHLNPKIKALVAISVPVDLLAGVHHIMRPANWIYERRFLNSLRAKVRQKAKQHPQAYALDKLSSVKTIYQFDDTYTAPVSGFKDAADYYHKCSAKQFITRLRLPTLLINALDDPFLPDACYPYEEVATNPQVELCTPRYGGHVGFVEFGKGAYWEENKMLEFLSQF